MISRNIIMSFIVVSTSFMQINPFILESENNIMELISNSNVYINNSIKPQEQLDYHVSIPILHINSSLDIEDRSLNNSIKKTDLKVLNNVDMKLYSTIQNEKNNKTKVSQKDIRSQANRTVDFIDTFKEDFAIEYFHKNWSEVDSSTPTETDLVPFLPAPPLPDEIVISDSYPEAERCHLAFHRFFLDLQMAQDTKFRDFRPQVNELVAQMDMLLSMIEIFIKEDKLDTGVTWSLLHLPVYETASSHYRKQRDFMTLRDCRQIIRLIADAFANAD
ncbi:unnamed protein product [Meganyctiphanes norvegica]|uniref:Uncharacterized protein n=1 Tax=Meganyctiphanes norvegica TaxID=48144 RepID=A0AAV2SDX1_MEGNR